MAGNVRSGAAWHAARARVIREERDCFLCGHPVDRTIPYRDPHTKKVNPDSPSVHHLDPHPTPETVAIRSRLRLTHHRCNVSFGDGSRVKSRTSRKW